MTQRPEEPPFADPRAADARDWALIARTGQGDRGAFETLYKAYFRYLFRFVYQVTRRLDLVEDVINEVMLVVWQKAATVTPLARASTWILGIAHHKALQAAAKAGVVLGAGADPAWEDVDETDIQGAQEADRLFAQAMRHLSPDQRAVLELVYHHELNYPEIAEILGVPENTVKTRVFHARRRLRGLWPALSGRLAPDPRQEGNA